MTGAATARLRLLAAAVLFSTAGAGVKASAFSAWQTAGLRSTLAAAAILLMYPAARRGWSLRALGIGVVYAMTMLLFVNANRLTTAASVIYLQSAAPLYILALGPWLLKERARREDYVLMAIVAAGLATFFLDRDPVSASAPNPILGNVLAVASGLFWAFTVMGLRWLGSGGQGGSGPAALVAGNIVAAAVGLALGGPLPSVGVSDWMVIAYLGIFQIGLAYVFIATAMPHVPALEASVLMLVEPALSPVWAFLVQGEVPGLGTLAGGALILGAATVKTFRDSRRPASVPEIPLD